MSFRTLARQAANVKPAASAKAYFQISSGVSNIFGCIGALSKLLLNHEVHVPAVPGFLNVHSGRRGPHDQCTSKHDQNRKMRKRRVK